ncbi:MAG: hypothetical protein FJ225_11960 [Lentisphaerae bacterium]|nr:hypothetical protein [Lentisphaerota bacterium]
MNCTAHIFTNSGALTVTTGGNVDVLVVGGGGGAGGVGANGKSSGQAGNGGPGMPNAISGVTNWYAGGGGGGVYGSGSYGAGGSGIGGAGGDGTTAATSGQDNTGSGGGGQGQNRNSTASSHRGGSGIVIVRYVTGGSNPNADSDGDGMSDANEEIAGTDPHNAASCLVLYAPTNSLVVDGKFVVRWQSVSNKHYTVMATTNLIVAFTNLFPTNIVATPSVNVYTDSVGNAAQRYYRVRVE